MINGQKEGSTNALPTTAGQWQNYEVTWNSEANTSATLAIVDQNLPSLGTISLWTIFRLRKRQRGRAVGQSNKPLRGATATFTASAAGPASLS